MMPAIAVLLLLAGQSVPGEIIGHRLRVPGERVVGTTERLSEVERDIVDALPPQGQAEKLLQYAISHHEGASDEIKTRVSAWRGAIARSPALAVLLDVAHNGANLRVRAAAIEIELAVLGVAKTAERVEALLRQVQANPSDSRQAIWTLGFLGNRGIETARVHAELRLLLRHPDPMVRYQAVAAIAYLGTDDSVPDLVQAFHLDPASQVRINGGGCGLAHCGMLTRSQRMLAVPGLIAMVEDAAVDPETRMYGYRALREITDERLGDDPHAWRDWHRAHGAERVEQFRQFERSQRPF